MKKRLSFILATIAMLMTGAATMGCIIVLHDEPKALESMID